MSNLRLWRSRRPTHVPRPIPQRRVVASSKPVEQQQAVCEADADDVERGRLLERRHRRPPPVLELVHPLARAEVPQLRERGRGRGR